MSNPPADHWLHVGTSTPGPPGGSSTSVGTGTHTLLYYVIDIAKCGDRLHVFHGDWMTHPHEIYRCPKSGAYLATPVQLTRTGV